jgi:hypothetical protein
MHYAMAKANSLYFLRHCVTHALKRPAGLTHVASLRDMEPLRHLWYDARKDGHRIVHTDTRRVP